MDRTADSGGSHQPSHKEEPEADCASSGVALDDDLATDEEAWETEEGEPDDDPGESPRFQGLGRGGQGAVILLALLLILASLVAGVQAFEQSTWTYSSRKVDLSTTARLAELHSSLVAAGAPEAAVQALAVASRPGIYLGDAVEALLRADKAMDKVPGDPAMVEARREVRMIYKELYRKDHGWGPDPTPETLSPR